jgi:hypothetical protein
MVPCLGGVDPQVLVIARLVPRRRLRVRKSVSTYHVKAELGYALEHRSTLSVLGRNLNSGIIRAMIVVFALMPPIEP